MVHGESFFDKVNIQHAILSTAYEAYQEALAECTGSISNPNVSGRTFAARRRKMLRLQAEWIKAAAAPELSEFIRNMSHD